MGQNRKSHRRIALRGREELLPQGLITSQRRRMRRLTPILQVVSLGVTGQHMCEGEFESLKAIHAVSPSFVPEPYAWGKYTHKYPETYFLLAEFRDVGKQVRALRFAILISTHDMKRIGQLPFQLPIASQMLSKSISVAYYPYRSDSFLVLCYCLKANHYIAGKSYKARGWPGQPTQGICISHRKIWLPHGYLSRQDCSSGRHLGRLMVCSLYWTP